MEQTIEIVLKNGVKWRLKDSQRAKYRLANIGTSKNVLTNSIHILWAYQDVKNPQNTPEDLAEILDFSKINEYMQKIREILPKTNAEEVKEVEEKKRV